jgi:hypothetical protein
MSLFYINPYSFAAASSGPLANGGNIIKAYSEGGIAYRAHIFTSGGTLTFSVAGDVQYLVVGGGGGGGRDAGGGGGAGGIRSGTGFAVTAQAYAITVGAGGNGSTSNGVRGSTGNSSIFDSITSNGGGGGGAYGDPTGVTGSNGGSGGGGGGGRTTGAAGGTGNTLSTTPSQGNNGSAGSGSGSSGTGAGAGGGAGAAGGASTTTAGGIGGIGVESSISGTATYYGGGGGGNSKSGSAQAGGLGGGGAGGVRESIGGTAGTANRGGGGGGSDYSFNGGAGGSGIVIVRYPHTPTPPVAGPVLWVDASLLATGTVINAATTPVANLGSQGVYSGYVSSIFPGTLDYADVRNFDYTTGDPTSHIRVERNFTALGTREHPSNGDTFIGTVKFDGTNLTHYQKTTAASTSATSASSGTFGCTSTSLGARQAQSGGDINLYSNVFIGEVLIYNSALNDTDRLAVISYLSTKWGV